MNVSSSPNWEIAVRAMRLAAAFRAIQPTNPPSIEFLDAVATELERIPHLIEVGTELAIQKNQMATELGAIRMQRDRLAEALQPFKSGEWGAILAWIVQGAPTHDQGIAAAAKFRQQIYAVDEALA